MSDARSTEDVLNELGAAANALSQALHQTGADYDAPATPGDRARPPSREARAAQYQLSWELHRAGEMVRQVAHAIEHARELAGRTESSSRHLPTSGSERSRMVPGLSL